MGAVTVPEVDAKATEPVGPQPASPFLSVDANQVRLLRDGREAYPTMLASIAAARREILFEMYWIQGDRAGLLFRDALLEKAREGVSVRVSYDAVGSIGGPSSMWDPVRAAGGEVFEFGSLSALLRRFRFKKLNMRDHRKILVVDGQTAFTGGMNVGDQWLPRESGGADWRDDAIEVRGPAAGELRSLFFETWSQAGRIAPLGVSRLARKPQGRVTTLTNRHGRARGIGPAYLRAIRRAEQRIDITNPYFLPGPIFLSALQSAQRRGVEVRILVPGQSDVWVVSMAMSAVIGSLLESNARVFAFQGRVLHAKTATFDDKTAMIGTYNLDPRSRRYNRECCVAVQDRDVTLGVRASFERDLESSEEVSLSAWKERPLSRRVFAWFAYPLRQFL